MTDQAEILRRRVTGQRKPSQARTIAVASGKGGVGKSNFCINFAIKLQQCGKKVLIFDLDIGMGNIDILLGISPKRTFVDLFQEDASVHDIIEQGPGSLSVIAGGSGLSKIFKLDRGKFSYFQKEFEKLTHHFDYILFDMGAGATEDSLRFIRSADEAIVVTTPEPTSITDGYAMIKHLIQKDKTLPVKVLINRSLHEKYGKSTFDRLAHVVKRFLQSEVHLLGILPDDRSVLEAVNHQNPFVLEHPKSKVSRALEQVVREYLNEDIFQQTDTGTFVDKLKRFVFER